MRTALVVAAMLFARSTLAQPGETAPQPEPTAPQPPAAPPAAPAEPPASPPAEAPKVDPAYGEAPDDSVLNDDDSSRPGLRRGRTIVVRYTPDRTRANMVMLGAFGGAAALFGGLGVYFHLESRSEADEVSAKSYTGRPWTQERQDTYDRSTRDSTIAGVLYGIGGALALTTAVLYIVTEPELQETIMTPHVSATREGAMIGGGWRF